MNSMVDFGINFSKGQLFGFLLNDAGTGIGGITVELQGAGITRTTQTGMDGKFSFLGLGPGTYSVGVQATSFPTGYSLQDLPTRELTVQPGSPARTEIKVKALRAISGKVTAYDKTELKPVPLAGITVRLKELSLEVKTGANGAYIFRNLPAGRYTVSIQYGGKEVSREVVAPPEPANIRDLDLDGGPKE